jgi:hypothetical protein
MLDLRLLPALCMPDCAAAGFAPVVARGGDAESIGNIISHNNTYIAICAKATQSAGPNPAAVLPAQPGIGTAPLPAAAVSGDAQQPATPLTAVPAVGLAAPAAAPVTAALLPTGEDQSSGSTQALQSRAAEQGDAAAAAAAADHEAALELDGNDGDAAAAAAGAVSAPELLEACKQHSIPLAKPWPM